MSETSAKKAGVIRVGIGGWTYAPWRGTFYPPTLTQARELAYASGKLTAIEINGTFYRAQTPKTYAKWRDETPDGFVFSVKAPRYITHRKVLADAGESIARFIGGGLVELGSRLGPILWQFAPTKHYEAGDFEEFLKLLPGGLEDAPLRHVVDVRHPSFVCAEFIALLRKYRVAVVYTDSDDYPTLSDITGDFVYARLMTAHAEVETGYSKPALKRVAARAHAWAQGVSVPDLPTLVPVDHEKAPRDVFVFFINGAKERAPAAAQALIQLL